MRLHFFLRESSSGVAIDFSIMRFSFAVFLTGSSVNIWEIQTKNLKSPDIFPYSADVIQALSVQANLRCVPVLPRHALTLKTLSYEENAPKHNDPFDRMLLCQAKTENMLLMTHDSLIPYYNESCILSV